MMLAGFEQLTREQALLRLRAQLCKRNLADFVRGAWHIEHREKPLVWNWHLDAICEHLEAVSRGEITRLLINIPPGLMKSLLVSVYWPTWEWVSRPELQYIVVSATDGVSLRDARRSREVIESEWYQRAFLPPWHLSDSQQAKSYYINTAGGARLSRTTGQKIIGLRGDRIVVDDPLDASDAHTGSAALAEHTRWFDEDLSDRTNDVDSPIVVIMQRLHEADLSGHLLEHGEGRWEHLCLPAEFEVESACRTSIGFRDPRKEPGEPLFEERLPKVKRDEIRINSRIWAGKYQQRPAPVEGAIFKREWIKFWTPETLPPLDFTLGSWDCTYKDTRHSNFVVGETWGSSGANRYLLPWVRRERYGIPEHIEAVKLQKQAHPEINIILIEETGNGPAVLEALRSRIPGMVGVPLPDRSKEARAHAVTPLFEAGQIYLPHPQLVPGARWIEDVYLPELLSFPRGRFDDHVDATTQALLYLNRHAGGFWSMALSTKNPKSKERRAKKRERFRKRRR